MQNTAAQSTLFEQGVDMMLYGMGSVFVFLLALVLAISVMSRLISRFFPEPLPVQSAEGSVSGSVDPLTRKVIQAAIDQHRGR